MLLYKLLNYINYNIPYNIVIIILGQIVLKLFDNETIATIKASKCVEMLMMPYVYVLYSLRDGKKYTGMCGSLRRRLAEHRLGLVRSTAHRRPLVLIYYEWCRSWEDARRREKYLKTSGGKRYLKNRLKMTLSFLTNGGNGQRQGNENT